MISFRNLVSSLQTYFRISKLLVDHSWDYLVSTKQTVAFFRVLHLSEKYATSVRLISSTFTVLSCRPSNPFGLAKCFTCFSYYSYSIHKLSSTCTANVGIESPQTLSGNRGWAPQRFPQSTQLSTSIYCLHNSHRCSPWHKYNLTGSYTCLYSYSH